MTGSAQEEESLPAVSRSYEDQKLLNKILAVSANRCFLTSANRLLQRQTASVPSPDRSGFTTAENDQPNAGQDGDDKTDAHKAQDL